MDEVTERLHIHVRIMLNRHQDGINPRILLIGEIHGDLAFHIRTGSGEAAFFAHFGGGPD